jgi:ABC-type transport system involved in cytochrome bd biosynthesis fused ATPase/permease subunit
MPIRARRPPSATARSSDALVIHGPSGTGKSQTIANIIGDHLARGERVLFVCDKRTAIDAVKYRLEALSLGALCGAVHNPARDRIALYRQLLATSPVAQRGLRAA